MTRHFDNEFSCRSEYLRPEVSPQSDPWRLDTPKTSASNRRQFVRRALLVTASLAVGREHIGVAETARVHRPPSFFGVNADLVWDFDPSEYTKVGRALNLSGVGSLRLPIRWRVVEPQRGVLNWQPIDDALAAVPRHVEVLGMFLSVPSWASGVDPASAKGWFDIYMPRDFNVWADFVGQAVRRYRDRIRYWEVWNEENGIDFFRPAPDVKKYLQLLSAAHRAAKRANPRCKVVLGGLQMNGVIANPWSAVKTPNFLEDIYRAGGKSLFDICNTHPYVSPGEGGARVVELTRDTRAVMSKYGDAAKPLWLTEEGFGLNNGTTADEQARFLRECYEAAANYAGVERLFWFTLRDLKKDLLGPESSMGLITKDWQPKPAFEELRKLTTLNKHSH